MITYCQSLLLRSVSAGAKLVLLGCTVLTVLPTASAQDRVSFSFDSGEFILRDSFGAPLVDGRAIEFGYYTEASALDLFAGSWVSLLSLEMNGVAAGGESGQVAYAGFSLPVSWAPDGQIMAIRFYDGDTVASSFYYGAVSSAHIDAGLVWPGVVSNIMLFQMGGIGTTWLDDNVAFTGTPIPEPAQTVAFAGIIIAGAVLLRRYSRR